MVNLTGDDLNRLKNLIEMGVRTKVEIKDLNEALREASGEVAKELDLPKGLLNKAISVAARAEETGSVDAATAEKQEELDAVIEILHATGRR